MPTYDASSPIVRVNPTVTAAAYSSGDVVGGLLTIGADTGQRPFGRALTGLLKSFTVKDNANQKAALTVLLFDQLPGGTYTDKSAFSWGSGDFAKCVGKFNVQASDYETVGSKAVAQVELSRVVQNLSGSDRLYAVVVTTGTPTYAATTDVEFQFGFLNDG